MNVGEIYRFMSENFREYNEGLHVIVCKVEEYYVVAKNIANLADVRIIYNITFSSWEKVS